MTTDVKARKPAAAKTRAKPKTPGPLEKAVSAGVEKLFRAVWPYAVPLCLAAIATFVIGASWPLLLTLGGVLAIGGLRLHEASRLHRRGGRAAARKRRKYQGVASRREIAEKLGVKAARKRAQVTRPSAAGGRRMAHADAGITLGTTLKAPKQTLMATHEDTVIYYAGPRKGKTGSMSSILIDAPGFGLSTSTRPDVWGHTSIPRSKRGPVLTLDPDPFSGIGSSLKWDMLDGCVLPAIAIERAGYLVHAAPKDATGKDAWWDHQSAELLRLLMHAGELAGANLLDVRAWAADPSTKEPVEVLYKHNLAAPGWAAELDELASSTDGEFLQNVARGAATALSWLSDPAMAAVACPAPGQSMDAWQLIAEGGTAYLIGANKPHGSIAAFNASLTSHLWETGKRMAAQSIGYRLDPPALFVIDEPAITCPVPLDRWLAEAGGWGMPVVTGVQSPAQLIRQWGTEGARIIRDCATVELVFGGNTDDKELESISSICGPQDSWEHIPGTGGKSKQPREVPLYPPQRIRTLADGHAVVLHRSARPVEALVRMVWDHPEYERAEVAPAYAGPAWPDGTPVITGNAEPVLTPGDETLTISGRN